MSMLLEELKGTTMFPMKKELTSWVQSSINMESLVEDSLSYVALT